MSVIWTSPAALWLLALVPLVWVAARYSRTNFNPRQHLLQTIVRTLVLAAPRREAPHHLSLAEGCVYDTKTAAQRELSGVNGDVYIEAGRQLHHGRRAPAGPVPLWPAEKTAARRAGQRFGR